jgi:hypothetical protein
MVVSKHTSFRVEGGYADPRQRRDLIDAKRGFEKQAESVGETPVKLRREKWYQVSLEPDCGSQIW